jgi:hypothetical protein
MNGATSPHPLATAVQPDDSRHTFVCYSRRDIDFVLDLASRLHEREVPVWLDLWDIGIGEDWDRTIDAALKGCATFLIVLSPDAVRSDEVRGELRSALNNGKPVVPVLYRPCDLPRQLQNTQYLDLTDSAEPSEEVLDDLVGTLQGEAVTRAGRWRHWRKPWTPLAWAGGRLRAVGASAAGAAVLLAVSGLLVEASYARLLGIGLSLTPATVLSSGLQFFITLLTVALWLTLPAALVLLVVAPLRLAGRRWLPTERVVERLRHLLARPGLLWAAQAAAYVLLFFVSIPAFAELLPLPHVVLNNGLMAAQVDTRSESAYGAVVLHVGSATLAVVALEAWRRRLQRKRQYRTHADALVSLGLALPLYLLVSAELLLLPVGHGLLKLPSRREYSRALVTFRSSVPEVELRGRSLLLLELRPAPRHTFYCPHGSTTWEVDEREVESLAGRTTGTLARLLGEFRPLTSCEVGGRAPEEVPR